MAVWTRRSVNGFDGGLGTTSSTIIRQQKRLRTARGRRRWFRRMGLDRECVRRWVVEDQLVTRLPVDEKVSMVTVYFMSSFLPYWTPLHVSEDHLLLHGQGVGLRCRDTKGSRLECT